MFGTEQTRWDYKRILRSVADEEADVGVLFKSFWIMSGMTRYAGFLWRQNVSIFPVAAINIKERRCKRNRRQSRSLQNRIYAMSDAQHIVQAFIAAFESILRKFSYQGK